MLKKILLGAAGLVMLSTASASAYTITVQEWANGGPITAAPFTYPTLCATVNHACAEFTYSGPLAFNNTQPQNSTPSGDLNSDFFIAGDISGYTGLGSVFVSPNTVANFNTLAGFLASSGSISGEAYGSEYGIDLGTIYAGTLLTITHDDGVCVYSGGACLGGFTNGPVAAVTESVTLGTSGDVMLYYTRQNGTPSILDVTVPEPASIAVFGAALICMAGMAGWMRRSRASV
jgi:hypothetical protein